VSNGGTGSLCNRSPKPIAHTRWRRFQISLIVARFGAIPAVVQPGKTDDCGAQYLVAVR